MNQEEADNLNRRVTRGDVEYVIKKKKIPYKLVIIQRKIAARREK